MSFFNKGTCYSLLMQFTILNHPNMMARIYNVKNKWTLNNHVRSSRGLYPHTSMISCYNTISKSWLNTFSLTIDASRRGNVARFVNHCCDPNCTTETWCVERHAKILIIARKDVEPDTELVIVCPLASPYGRARFIHMEIFTFHYTTYLCSLLSPLGL